MIWSSAQAQVSDGEQRTPLGLPGVERNVKEPKHRDLRLVAREAQSTRIEGTPIQDILGCHADMKKPCTMANASASNLATRIGMARTERISLSLSAATI